ncbi:MAG: hypothetical protein IKA48_01620 [Fibrobacter sp.]|nr:hypothetical protein [Fibrobacter sp.]
MSYDCAKEHFDDANIFVRKHVWESTALTDVFYGQVAIMTETMAESGAIPGILALCPTVVPITGNWLFRRVVEKLGESDSEIKTSVFLDSTNYKSVLDCDDIASFRIVVSGCSAEECETKVPTFRGWTYDTSTEIEPSLYLVDMKKRNDGGIADVDLGAEIDRIELEMNEPTEDELLPNSQKELDRLISTILQTWEVFGKYDYDMPKFLSKTEGMGTCGSINLDPDNNEMFGGEGDIFSGDDDIHDQITGPNGEALEAPASLRVVKVMAKTINDLSDFTMKIHTAAVQALAKSNLNEEKLREMDAMVADAMRAMNEKCDGVRDYNDERISGLRHQIAILVVHDRARRYVPVLLSVISLLIAIMALFVK